MQKREEAVQMVGFCCQMQWSLVLMASFLVHIEEIWVVGEDKIQCKMLIVSDGNMNGTLTTFVKLADLNPSSNQFSSDFLCSDRILIKSSE